MQVFYSQKKWCKTSCYREINFCHFEHRKLAVSPPTKAGGGVSGLEDSPFTCLSAGSLILRCESIYGSFFFFHLLWFWLFNVSLLTFICIYSMYIKTVLKLELSN